MNEQTLKQFYQLKTLDPTDYVAHSLQSVDFEYDEDLNKQYDLLQKLINSNSTQLQSTNGAERKDDAEPLKFNDSMVEELLEHDIIDDSRDPSKRKYFISDESFDVDLYLSLHRGVSKKELFSRLEYLDQDIAMRQQNLSQVLHTEFRRFINIKNSLGDTMERFSKEKELDSLKILGDNLKQASQESNNILTPLVDAKDKESMIRLALNFINENKFLFNLPHTLQNDIKMKDYDSLVYDYKKGKYQYSRLLEAEEHRKISGSNAMLLDKIWDEVEYNVNGYKKLLWEKLNNININNLNTSSFSISININNDQNCIALMYKLLELNVEDNPIIDFINVQYYKIENEIEEKFDSYLKNITLLQSNILSTYSLESTSSLSFLIRLLKDGNILNNNELLTDLPLVLDLWSLVQQFVSNFTSLIAKIVKFSSIVDFVVNGDLLKQHNEYALKKSGNEYQSDDRTIQRHLRFEKYEVKKLKEQNEKLVLKVCDNLIQFFTKSANEIQTSGPLQFFSEEDIKNTPFEYGFLPPLTNATTASVQNIQIYNSISSNFQNLANSKTSISRNTNVIEALKTTCVKVNQNLQASVISLLVNDMKYSYKLELDDDTNLIELIEMYYGLFIKKSSNLVHQQEITNDFKIVPSKKLLAGFETSFLKSLNYFIEANLKRNLVDEGEDAKYKTLMNFYRLKNELRPKILVIYDQYFKSNLSNQQLQIFEILDNLELEIFENLTAPITKKITFVFNSNVENLSQSSPYAVSKTTREIISILVSTKVECLHLKLSSFLTLKVLSKLIGHTLIKIQDFIKSTEIYEQILVDLKYLELYFDDYIKRNELLIKSIDKIYGILSNKVNMRRITSQIDDIVNKSIRDSKIELES